MIPEALQYLKTQRVGVFAVEMLDGSPHAATLHFAHSEDPLVFYFKTHRGYRKVEPLSGRDVSRASFVVGSDESNMKTLQLDGNTQLVPQEEMEHFNSIYLGKFSEKNKGEVDPDAVHFKFTPTWWRFTDWTTPEGKKIWVSDN